MGRAVVKPAKMHFASLALRAPYGTLRGAAPCPNVQPRAHARLIGLTSRAATLNVRQSICAHGKNRPRSPSSAFGGASAEKGDHNMGAASPRASRNNASTVLNHDTMSPCTPVLAGLAGCAAPFYVSLRSKQQSLRYPGKPVRKVKYLFIISVRAYIMKLYDFAMCALRMARRAAARLRSPGFVVKKRREEPRSPSSGRTQQHLS